MNTGDEIMSQRHRRWVGIAALAGGLALAACGEAPAQHQQGTTHRIHTDRSNYLEVLLRGRVEFTDDERGVARLSDDGRLSIEERRPGQPERRVEFRAAEGGGVRTLYHENGVTRAPDAEARAWIERVVLREARENGANAERRVARIRAREGTDGVLREIERIESDHGRKAHYRALLATPGVRGDEAARVIRHVGRTLRSDGEKRAALASALDGAAGAAELAAVLDAAGTIRSDGERASLLARVARDHALSDGRVRAAFFRAAEGIGSDGEMARVLTAALRHESAGGEVAAAAARASERIGSDGERARVLVAVPDRALRSAPVRAAVARAMDGIGSNGERERVARRLARSGS